jgi:DNA-binding NarL/FixJ family response regulator
MPDGAAAKPIACALVAEDHGVTRFGLTQFLRDRMNVKQVLEASRFMDATDQLANQPVDLAIFDLDIPGLKSPKELLSVRERWPDVKVVVLTANAQRSSILAALEAGVHGYIVKTDSMDDLAERLGYVVSGEIYVPPTLAEISGGLAGEDEATEAAAAAGLPKLTLRQRQVLRSIVKGHSNKQIAKDLKLAVGTVKMHVSAVLTALGAQNRSHAASLGRKLFD